MTCCSFCETRYSKRAGEAMSVNYVPALGLVIYEAHDRYSQGNQIYLARNRYVPEMRARPLHKI